jgi:hypothetical protein
MNTKYGFKLCCYHKFKCKVIEKVFLSYWKMMLLKGEGYWNVYWKILKICIIESYWKQYWKILTLIEHSIQVFLKYWILLKDQ